MKAEPQRTCPSCGNELSGAMEFCPVCMLRKGLACGIESGESSVSEDMVRPAPEQSRQRFEHYELVTGEDGKPVELGRGAMGVTYKAFDVNLRCTVTLKVINEKYLGDESARLRFLHEARAAASVRHSNVASVVHLGIRGQDYFYAMEFVEGEALGSLIERSGHLEVKLALEIATQVAAGLAAVHKQKLVHRDIKPGNIMVSFEDGGDVTAKIIDLGLAKTIHEAGSKTAISIPGWFAGTPEFASPEQFAGVGVDIRSDLYSLGVTLWEMVVGRAPFRGSPGEIMYQHQHAPLPLEQLRDVPQPVAVLISTLLDKDPAKRFQNPAELLKAMPTIIGAVDEGRTITRQSFQKMLPTGLEFEHYQLLRNADDSIMELGRGSMGVTYKAFDTNLHSYVALKVITANLLESENAAERFLREARAAACLRHRNVASVFHLGKHGDSYFYAMEFIDGETVFSRVERDGPLDCLFGLEIAQQVACALIAAEEQQIVHRDIKPSNLMLVRESDGEILAKVIDFGIAKSSIRESKAAGTLTIKGFVGSPYFASPEQLERRPEDIRSDIYSLGVTLWYMLTGKPTFMGSMASVIAQHLEKAPAFESLALLPAQVVTVLRRMLEKDMTKRIQTPSQLRVELRHCVETVAALQAASRPKGAINEHFETIAFSTAQIPVFRPESGSQLKNRYRLIEDVDPANPRHTFHAEDIVARMRVTVRIFAAEASIQKQIDEEAGRIKGASHPNFVHVFSVEREESFSFVVLEWLEGLQLVDLLRARRGLTLRETLMLLEQIAPAVDAAGEASLRLEMNLRDILVYFPEGFAEPTANVVLRCPLDEWPTFVVKMSLLGRLKEVEASVQLAEGQTIVSDLKPQRDVFQLGALVYELLGGKRGGFAPLTNVSEKGNEVLRKCLTSGRGFSTACEFCDALAGTANAGSGRVAKIQKVPEPERLPAARLDPPLKRSHGQHRPHAFPLLARYDPRGTMRSCSWGY
jgi:serine/threonine protein kinase